MGVLLTRSIWRPHGLGNSPDRDSDSSGGSVARPAHVARLARLVVAYGCDVAYGYRLIARYEGHRKAARAMLGCRVELGDD